MHCDGASPPKRRCVSLPIAQCDATAVIIKQEADAGSVEFEWPVQTVPALDRRLVMLKFKTPDRSDIVWTVPHHALSRVPIYAQQLREATEKTLFGRMSVIDVCPRNADLMFHLFDYLTSGNVDLLHEEGHSQFSLWLIGPLFALIKDLEIEGLVDELSIYITEHKMEASKLADVADACCDYKSGVDTSEKSILGSWIRTYLSTHLPELEEAGCTDSIATGGGDLAKILMKVVLDDKSK